MLAPTPLMIGFCLQWLAPDSFFSPRVFWVLGFLHKIWILFGFYPPLPFILFFLPFSFLFSFTWLVFSCLVNLDLPCCGAAYFYYFQQGVDARQEMFEI
jgi:hypothetical protein